MHASGKSITSSLYNIKNFEKFFLMWIKIKVNEPKTLCSEKKTEVQQISL